jgi:tetratricopeptide (TPR) repeat protein
MEVATALAFRHYAVGEPLIRAQLAAASISPRQRARWLRMLGGVLIIQGRFREADAALKQEESAWLQSDTPDNAVVPRALRANFLSRDLGRLDQARSELAALERQYPQAVATAIGPRSVALVEAAVSAGDLDRAHRYLANAERTLSAAPGGFAFPLALARAALVGGGADKAQALEALRMSRAASICWPCIQGMAAPGLDQMGQRDSALVYYQGFLDAPEPGWDIPVFPTAQASAYRRLGELYEWKGNRERALESYRKFVELWKDADPAVQPRVAEARRRIEELSREGR